MLQQELDYARIEAAIHYIKDNLQAQPSLEEIAAAVQLSPFHFQKLFSEWAGVSPKKFTQYLTLQYAKSLLQERSSSLMETALASGLSGTGRLHDLFVGIEAMTPGDFKRGGAGLTICYSFAPSPFGELILASTAKGICHLFFIDDKEKALAQLGLRFPNARLENRIDEFQCQAMDFFLQDWNKPGYVKLHLLATPFQLKVWESLLKIPMGKLTTYGDIAGRINAPNAARAVGTAIGSNPIAFLIPCHRVIQGSGHLGGYMWGETRKSAMIGWEASQLCRTSNTEPDDTTTEFLAD